MQRWKLSALAAASLALSSLAATDAWALALGRITVQSALGEPLRAEVEIPQLSAVEADSLQAAIASPAAFRAQGMEYTGTANSVRVKVQKRANGTAVLQLSSAQPVNDPFVDLVIDTNWASGKLQRNYTLLLDPPTSRRPAPAPVAAAQVAPAEPAARPVRPATVEPAPAAAAGRDLRNDRDQAEASPKRQRQAPAPAAGSSEVRVKTGDTAGRIAAAYKPAGVSLDQMLVAMLRSNPQAFVDGNVNRMRSGAVVQLPDEATAQATSAKEARQIMAAQSRDFNQFRRQLAGVAPVAPVEAASRAASGQVQAHVEDSKAGTAAPDKLTLSKGSVKGAAADERLAQQKQAADQSARTDELKRNMAELSQIAAATKPAGSTAAPATGAAAPSAAPGLAVPAATVAGNTAASAAPATPAPAPAAAAETAKPEAAAAAEPAAAATPAADAPAADASPAPAAEAPAPAPAPAPAAKPKPAPAPVAPPEEPSFIDGLMDDPAIPLAGAALLALLLGYGGYRVAQRRKAAAAASTDSSLGDSQLAADSFFGASGGQRVDTTTTNSSQLSGQSMQYSPSQLDAGDVDPLAEADVYLAYGRDLQAEEILKEALRSDPNRLVLHQKLAEIYAKRHDRIAYAAVANNLYALTQGKGPEWLRLADQGRILDPDNQLYQPGGSPQSATASAASPAEAAPGLMGGAVAGLGFGAALASANSAADDREGPPTMPSGLELDLNRPEPQAAQSAVSPDLGSQPQWEAPAAAAEPLAAADNSLNLDLNDLASFSLPTAQAPVAEPAAEAPAASLNALEFDLDSFSLPSKSETAAAPADQVLSLGEEPAAAEPMVPPSIGSAPQSEPSFDLSGLSLDLGTPETATGTGSTSLPAEPEDPLATKLALAEEFNAIGDSDGARTLMEEVIAEAHGDLKARAQSLLSQIG